MIVTTLDLAPNLNYLHSRQLVHSMFLAPMVCAVAEPVRLIFFPRTPMEISKTQIVSFSIPM